MHMVCRLLNEINRLALVPLWRLLPVNILWRRSRRFAQEKSHKIVCPRNDDGFKAMSSCRRGSYRAAKKCEVSRLVVKEGNIIELARHAWEQMSWQMNSQRSLHWGQRRKKRFIYHVTPLMRLHHHRRIVGSSFTARRRLFGAKNVRKFRFFSFLFFGSRSDSLQSISDRSSHKFFSLNPLNRIACSHNWISISQLMDFWGFQRRVAEWTTCESHPELLIISFIEEINFRPKRLWSSHKFVLHSCRLLVVVVLITSGEYEFFSDQQQQRKPNGIGKYGKERKLSTVGTFNTFFVFYFGSIGSSWVPTSLDPTKMRRRCVRCASWW